MFPHFARLILAAGLVFLLAGCEDIQLVEKAKKLEVEVQTLTRDNALQKEELERLRALDSFAAVLAEAAAHDSYRDSQASLFWACDTLWKGCPLGLFENGKQAAAKGFGGGAPVATGTALAILASVLLAGLVAAGLVGWAGWLQYIRPTKAKTDSARQLMATAQAEAAAIRQEAQEEASAIRRDTQEEAEKGAKLREDNRKLSEANQQLKIAHEAESVAIAEKREERAAVQSEIENLRNAFG